jgi:DNA-binding transcriptional regulator YhcF (GntR family)
MDRDWNDSQPIYRQVRDMLVEMILDGVVKEEEALPVVRYVATEFRLNPLTVIKAYQQLVNEGIVEGRRGVGMFVKKGAHKKLLAAEREKFLKDEWPRVYHTILRLGLDPEELLRLSAPEETEVERDETEEGEA